METTKKMEGFIDLKRRKKVEGVPDLTVGPIQPELHHRLKDTQTFSEVSLNPSKAFQHEGPTVPEQTSPIYHYENPFEKFGINLSQVSEDYESNDSMLHPISGTQPVDYHEEGIVKYTTYKALKNMVKNMKTQNSGTHGCIVDGHFQPDGDKYLENIHFFVGQCLGKGSNGKADLCYDTKSCKPFVRKKIPKSALRPSEVLVPINLDHKNITKFYGLMQEENADGILEMVLMLENGGIALNRFLLNNTLDESQIKELTKQGLSGLKQLGYFEMIHLDIKPENICLTKNSDDIILKITDFGSAKLPTDPLSFCGWTPEYMAPESCKLIIQNMKQEKIFGVGQDSITHKVDVFGFGLVVMYLYKRYHIMQRVITNGKTSYAGIDPNEVQVLQVQLMKLLATEENIVQDLIPDECDLDMRELLKQMTTHDYSGRPNAEQCLQVVKESEMKRKMWQRQKGYTSHSVSKVPESTRPMIIPVDTFVAESAVNHMAVGRGQIKNITTKGKLRQNLEKGPYPQKSGKGFKKIAPNKTVPPQTPVEEMKELTLNFPCSAILQKAEKTSQFVMQATQEDGGFVPTNGHIVEATLAPTVPSTHHQSLYHTSRRSGPMQVNDRTTDVPMLVFEEPVKVSYNKDYEKLMFNQRFSRSEEEGCVVDFATQDQANLKKTEDLMFSDIYFGNTDRTVDRHPIPDRMPMDIIPPDGETDHMSTEQSTDSPAEDWAFEVNMTEVGQGNIPDFSSLF